MHLDTAVDLNYFAQRTEGYTGADLQALLYNGYLESIQLATAVVFVRNPTLEDHTPGHGPHSTILSSPHEPQRGKETGLSADTQDTPFQILSHSPMGPAARQAQTDLSKRVQQLLQPVTADPATLSTSATTLIRSVPTISHEHLMKALEESKPSLSPTEAKRLRHMVVVYKISPTLKYDTKPMEFIPDGSRHLPALTSREQVAGCESKRLAHPLLRLVNSTSTAASAQELDGTSFLYDLPSTETRNRILKRLYAGQQPGSSPTSSTTTHCATRCPPSPDLPGLDQWRKYRHSSNRELSDARVKNFTWRTMFSMSWLRTCFGVHHGWDNVNPDDTTDQDGYLTSEDNTSAPQYDLPLNSELLPQGDLLPEWQEETFSMGFVLETPTPTSRRSIQTPLEPDTTKGENPVTQASLNEVTERLAKNESAGWESDYGPMNFHLNSFTPLTVQVESVPMQSAGPVPIALEGPQVSNSVTSTMISQENGPIPYGALMFPNPSNQAGTLDFSLSNQGFAPTFLAPSLANYEGLMEPTAAEILEKILAETNALAEANALTLDSAMVGPLDNEFISQFSPVQPPSSSAAVEGTLSGTVAPIQLDTPVLTTNLPTMSTSTPLTSTTVQPFSKVAPSNIYPSSYLSPPASARLIPNVISSSSVLSNRVWNNTSPPLSSKATADIPLLKQTCTTHYDTSPQSKKSLPTKLVSGSSEQYYSRPMVCPNGSSGPLIMSTPESSPNMEPTSLSDPTSAIKDCGMPNGYFCSQCKATSTTQWRKRRETGDRLCNACALYERSKNAPRPLDMAQKNSVPRRRRRKKTSEGTSTLAPVKKLAKLV
ncbi:Peroxisome biosynthesis protein pex1 [Dispira simplex]|nr:Peroxisome biosynthesis protein pex1 [Dispira simplex]